MRILSVSILFLFTVVSPVLAGNEPSNAPRVFIETSEGKILLELNPQKAPKTVDNFLTYIRSGFYNGTVFHRVISDFMIQGGGFTVDMERKTCGRPIENEADNGLKNGRGTIAMARTSDPHSASSQFFINTADNHFLDHKGKQPKGWGYAVFGKVIQGMDVVDAISKVRTGVIGRFRDIPLHPIVIQRAWVID